MKPKILINNGMIAYEIRDEIPGVESRTFPFGWFGELCEDFYTTEDVSYIC